MRWLHIISVGTSLLRNFVLMNSELAEELGISDVLARNPLDEGIKRLYGYAWRGSKVYEAVRSFLENDPLRASAELNAFLRYVGLSSQSPPDEVGVILFSSDTGHGFFCSKLLYDYLKDEGYSVVGDGPRVVKGLGISPEGFDDSLSELFDKVVVSIQKYSSKGIPVYINLTAGFKAESAFLVLASSLAGARVAYYIHESFNEVVEMPLPLMKLDTRLVRLIRKFQESSLLTVSEFEEFAREAGLDPLELLSTRLFFEVKGEVMPKKWLLKLIGK